VPRLLAIRLSLALTALVLFALGIRGDSTYLRMAGIVLLGAALILRFVGGRTPRG
jgi:hypothetical protein